MQRHSLPRFLLYVVLLAAVSVIFIAGSSFSARVADDFWKQLGITQSQGTDKIKNSFVSGYAQLYGLRNAKNIAAGQRAAVAADLLGYTRTFLSSAEFSNYYAAERASRKPVAPTETIKTKEQVRAGLISQLEESIKESEKSMATVNADMKKIFQQSIDMLKKQVTEYKQPDNQLIELMYQGELQQHQAALDRYQEDMARWEKQYPVQVTTLVKTRLQKYLDIASTVDFSAELKAENGKMKFVNPAYEAKSYDWKMIFRAGKDVYEVTRDFVIDWMKGI